MAATQATQDKVQGIVKRLLAENITSGMVFDPILVQPEIDHDDEEYLHIYIVYDGEWKEPERTWKVGLQHLVLQEMPIDEMPTIPNVTFCEKNEWYEEIPEDELE